MAYFQRFSEKQCRYRDSFLKRPRSGAHLDDSEAKQITSSTRAAISRLPAEIFEEIFLLTQVVTRGSKLKQSSWCWITITRVSRSWRDIAVGYQRLWSYINAGSHTSVEQTAIYLQRSGTYPLTVSFDCPGRNRDSLQCLYLAMDHFCRIRELRIQAIPEIPFRLWSMISQNAAPVLEKLLIQTNSDELFDISSLFAGQAPKLQTLVLNVNSPSWTKAPIARGKKDLCINSRSSVGELQDLLTILSESPSLERLWIYSLTDLPLTDTKSLPSPIKLLSLRDLDVSCANFSRLTTLIGSTTTPAIMGWNIICKNYPLRREPKADPKAIIPCISNSKICRTLELTICPKYVTIKADGGSPTDQWENGQPLRKSLTYWWDYTEELLQRSGSAIITDSESVGFICSVIKGGFWCHTEELTIELEERGHSARTLNANLGHSTWLRLLSMLPRLRKINLIRMRAVDHHWRVAVEDDYRGLVKALTYDCKNKNGQVHIICPNLVELRLWGINLQVECLSLVQALRHRASKGRLLNRLAICKPFGWTFEILGSIKNSGVAEEIEITDVLR